ncbi:hypothetical protein PCE1_003824 [Barthelona sp. PCE]
MGGDSVKVVTRFRPINDREREEGVSNPELLEQVVFYTSPQTVEVQDGYKGRKKYTFDRVFDPSTTQDQFYDFAAAQIVDELHQGFNGTMFAYGQTGAGKSFTMFGADISNEELRGVIPRAIIEIFDRIENTFEDVEFSLRCSFLEIYNESINDLLNEEAKGLPVRESVAKGIFVDGLSEVPVSTVADTMDYLAYGETNRSVASHAMNKGSSRSHSVFQITLQQRDMNKGTTTTGKLNLVDLAGSEKIGKANTQGQMLKEGLAINSSLSALGKVIKELVEGKDHISYRNSKLTRILQDALGGNSKTTLMIACSPHKFNVSETINTMEFGKRAKSIKLKAKANKVLSPGEMQTMITKLKSDVKAIKTQNEELRGIIDWYKDNSGLECPVNLSVKKVSIHDLENLEKEMDDHIKDQRKQEEEMNKLGDVEDELNRLRKIDEDANEEIEVLMEEIHKTEEAITILEDVDEESLQVMKAENRTLQMEVMSLNVQLEDIVEDLDEAMEEIARLEELQPTEDTSAKPTEAVGCHAVDEEEEIDEDLDLEMRMIDMNIYQQEVDNKALLQNILLLESENAGLTDIIGVVDGAMDHVVDEFVIPEDCTDESIIDVQGAGLKRIARTIVDLRAQIASVEQEKEFLVDEVLIIQDDAIEGHDTMLELKEACEANELTAEEKEHMARLKHENRDLELYIEKLQRKIAQLQKKTDAEVSRKQNEVGRIAAVQAELEATLQSLARMEVSNKDMVTNLEKSERKVEGQRKLVKKREQNRQRLNMNKQEDEVEDFRSVLKNLRRVQR